MFLSIEQKFDVIKHFEKGESASVLTGEFNKEIQRLHFLKTEIMFWLLYNNVIIIIKKCAWMDRRHFWNVVLVAAVHSYLSTEDLVSKASLSTDNAASNPL